MNFAASFGRLFGKQPARRCRWHPRVAEVLEERLLLTDIAFFDVLKGQNFVQSSTSNPVLQGGAPFHLHASVHAPRSSVSSVALKRPTAAIDTFTQQSPQFLNLEKSFSTKAGLDTAYAAGNYTLSITHPLSVEFSPSLDVSAAAGLSPGSITFSTQVVAPNSSGVFHEVWSPGTPLVNVDGSVTATQFTATITDQDNASLTGSISATWNGSAYVGTYNFNGQSGTVTIPDAISATLTLPADAYPNAPHLTNFTAAQTVNPAADFTLTWDAFAGGGSEDLITLFIFDGNTQVFHTDAIPLPSNSPQLDGTVTSFALPKNTLQANKTYQGQLWFTNYTSIDTTSFPGAKGAAGYYTATKFTIKTGTAVETVDPDVVAYYVAKIQEFVQDDSGAPVLTVEDFPFLFVAHVEERETIEGTVNAATVKIPGVPEAEFPPELSPDGFGGWDLSEEFQVKSELDARYKAGKYTFTIDTLNQGLRSAAITLPSEAYPVTPRISNWADAQMIDATADFTLTWDAFTGGTTDDFIQVVIGNPLAPVFKTPDFWEPNALRGTARSVVIPAGTFLAGDIQTGYVLFANASTLDRTTYKGAIGTTAYGKLTTFDIRTIPPEGLLQFSAANFAMSETGGHATVTVTRLGGSAGEVTVGYSMSDGTATNGADYTNVFGTLTFADGVTSQTFDIPILDDAESEGHETVSLLLENPSGGAGLASRVTATLTILDDELLFGPGSFFDSDGDKYTIKHTGPGTVRIALDDPDGDGRGSVKAILLSDTTNTTAVSLTVTKATTGDGEVSIGRITGNGGLSSLTAANSDLIGRGINLAGPVGSITLDDILNGADLIVGGTLSNSTKLKLGDVAADTEVRSGATLSSLTTQSFRGSLIEAPAIGTLSSAAGPLLADLQLAGAVKTLTVKGGGAEGDWTAASFGTVSITGGGFTGTLRATGTAEQLKTTPSVSSLSITGGDLTGLLSGLAGFKTISVKKDSAGNGGSVLDSTLSAKSFGTITIGKNLVRSQILAGANLGLDQVVGGTGTNADSFAGGSIGTVTIGGFVQASILGAGLDPFGEVFHNGNDVVIGGKDSPLKSLTITGTASADSYFRAGLLPKSAKIAGATIATATDARFNDAGDVSVSQTDDEGLVTLELNGQSVSLQIVDEVSQRGIPGLIASATINTGTPGVAVLMVVDPTDQYSAEFMFLHGAIEPEGEALRAAANEPEGGTSGADLVINLFSQVPKTISTFELEDQLPAVPRTGIKTINVLEAIGTIVKIADQFTEGALSRTAAQNGWPLFKRPQQISLETANRQISETWRDDVGQKMVFGAAGLQLGLAPVAGAAAVGIVIDSGLAFRDSYLVNSNPDLPIFETEFLGVPLYFIDANVPISNAEMTPTVPPNETRPDSIAFFSRAHPNIAFEAVIGDGNQPIPVPPGEYELVQRKPGRPPVNSVITVPPGGGDLPLGMPDFEIASLELIPSPKPTGFLDPGTQIKFTVVARDSAGNIVPNDRLDLDCLTPRVFNPVGSTVGTLDAPRFEIDPLTGKPTAVLTIGDSDGAARVSAETCHGISSNSVLVSGLGLARFNLPIVSIGDIQVVEGPKGTTKLAKFPLSLNKPSTERIVVGFNSQIAGASGNPASATAGVDYQQRVGTVTFEPGQTEKTIDITVIGDDITEPAEQFLVGLLASLNMNYRYALKITARCTIIDDDQPGILVTPTSGLVTTESGGTATFTIKLNSQPTTDVTISLSSDDATEGSVSLTSVTFTPTNWKTAKSITVKGVNDTIIDGDIPYKIVTSPAVSADPNYEGLDPSDVALVNRDNDQPTSLTGTFQGTWSRPIAGFGDEVSELTWVLTQSGTSVTGTFTKFIIDSPIFSDIGRTVTGRLINGRISGNTLTIQTDGGTPFSGTFTLLHIEGLGGGGLGRGPFSLDRI